MEIPGVNETPQSCFDEESARAELKKAWSVLQEGMLAVGTLLGITVGLSVGVGTYLITDKWLPALLFGGAGFFTLAGIGFMLHSASSGLFSALMIVYNDLDESFADLAERDSD